MANHWFRTKRFIRSLLPVSLAGKIAEKKNFAKHSAGIFTWPTKSYEAWMLLQNFLYLTEPKTMAEFGAGRSSYYLFEYSLKFKADLMSFEQHFYYYLKILLGLKLSFLPNKGLYYAPIKDDWYDERVVNKALSTINNIDFLFYDGPSSFSKGKRNSTRFFDNVLPLLKELKFALIDDVHRNEINDIALFLKKELDLEMFYYVSYTDNTKIGFLFNKKYSNVINRLPQFLKEVLIKEMGV